MRLVVLGTSASTPVVVEAAEALELVVADDAGPGPTCTVVDLDDPLVREGASAAVASRVRAGGDVVVVGERLSLHDVVALFRAGACDVIEAPLHKRELILRLAAVVQRKMRIACIGGGSGLFSVLTAMKDVPRVLLTSIVTMSDDGGSSGRLRASFGVLPPGDVRRSLVALSNAPEVMSYVMQYRFGDADDGLGGHSLGNLLLTALSELTFGMQNAVKALGDVLNVHGIVKCVTERATTLVAELEDGKIVTGESAIDRCLERSSDVRLRRVWHEPSAETSADVVASIIGADLVVIGPGDLYTSVIASLVIEGVAEAVRASTADRIYVCNMMTKPGETSGYDVGDHVRAVVDALGADVLDHVLVSSTELDADAVRTYAERGQHPVAMSAPDVLAGITSAEIAQADVGDRAKLVRHDPPKLRAELLRLIARLRPSVVVD